MKNSFQYCQKGVKNRIIALGFIPFLFCLTAKCQTQFQGSFLMKFSTTYANTEDLYSLTWTIDRSFNSERMAMEIEDEMKKRGVNKKVIYNFSDSSWTMAMSIKDIKQGTKMGAKMMYKDSCKSKEIKIKRFKNNEIISGKEFKKIIIQKDEYDTELWITNQYNYDISKMYELLLHNGLMNPILKKGKWYEYHIKKGMIVKVKTINKTTGENYSFTIENIKQGAINQSIFDLRGYKISVIEEGQNCGVVIIE